MITTLIILAAIIGIVLLGTTIYFIVTADDVFILPFIASFGFLLITVVAPFPPYDEKIVMPYKFEETSIKCFMIFQNGVVFDSDKKLDYDVWKQHSSATFIKHYNIFGVEMKNSFQLQPDLK